jgi:hypothetical protein
MTCTNRFAFCVNHHYHPAGKIKTCKKMKMTYFAGVAVALLALTQISQAVPITGNIGFTGGLTYNTGDSASATQVTSWISPQVTLDSGGFAGIPSGTAAMFTPLIWNFNTAVPILNFWSVGGFTFELLSSYVGSQGGTPGVSAYVDVNGTGIVSGNGFTPTLMSFNLTSQDPKGSVNPDGWTFSASSASVGSVADGGSTVLLLGLALTGVALMMRKTEGSDHTRMAS